MTFAGVVTAAPARPGATRPTAVVKPTRRPVARARRRADRERRPGGAAAPAGWSGRMRDEAIRDALVVSIVEVLPWRRPWEWPVTGVRARKGLATRGPRRLTSGGRQGL